MQNSVLLRHSTGHPVISQLHSRASVLRRLLLELPRLYKRIILILLDFFLLCAVMVAAVWVRRFGLQEMTWNGIVLLAFAPAITVATFAWSGLYRLVTRYIGHRGNTRKIGRASCRERV